MSKDHIDLYKYIIENLKDGNKKIFNGVLAWHPGGAGAGGSLMMRCTTDHNARTVKTSQPGGECIPCTVDSECETDNKPGVCSSIGGDPSVKAQCGIATPTPPPSKKDQQICEEHDCHGGCWSGWAKTCYKDQQGYNTPHGCNAFKKPNIQNTTWCPPKQS